MRVLLISESGFQYLAAVLPALEARGVTFGTASLREMRGAIPAYLPRSLRSTWMSRAGAAALKARLAKFAPDLVHATGVRPVLFHALAALRDFPAVALVHERISAGGMNPLHPVDPFLFRHRRLDRIVMPSKAMLNNWMGNGYTRWLAPPERCEVLHYAFDLPPPLASAERAALRARLGLDPDALVIGTVCYIRPWKFVEFAAAVVAALRTERPVVLAVVGTPGRAEYMASIRAAGGERLRYLGPIPDAARMMGAFDLYLTPTRLPGESFGMAFAEAMAAGVPAITMNYGAAAEICEHGVTGFALPERVEVWRHEIDALLADPARLAAMGKAARERIAARFSPPVRAADYHRVYAAAIAERRTLAGANARPPA